MNKKILFILSLLSIVVFLSSCGGGGGGLSAPPGTNPGVPSVIKLFNVQNIVQTNATAYLKAKVLDGNGKPLPNVPVTFTNRSAPFGVLSATVVNTDAYGIATVTLNSAVPGFATIAVELSSAAGQIRERATVFFTSFDMAFPTLPDLSSLTLDVDSNSNFVFNEPSDFILFDPPGKTDAIIRATVKDESGAPLLNSAVTFGADSPDVSFPLGSSTTAPVVHTNAAGQASVLARVSPSILSSNSSTVNITASAVTPSRTIPNVITLLLKPVTISSVTVTADPSTVASGDTSEISALVKTNAGTPAPSGTMVNFATSGGVITPFSSTDATGLAKATLTAPTVTTAQDVLVSASVLGTSGQTNVSVLPGPLNVLPDTQTIGNPVPGNTVRYGITGGTPPYNAFSDNPTFVQVSVSSNILTASVVRTPDVDTTVNISVFDTKGVKQSVTLKLDVSPVVALTVMPTTQTISNPAVNNTAFYTIVGGIAPYSVFSDKPAIATATISGTTITATVETVPANTTTVTFTIFDATAASKTVTLILDVTGGGGGGGGGGTAPLAINPAAATLVGIQNPDSSAVDNLDFVLSGGSGVYNCSSSNPTVINSPGSIAFVPSTFTIDPNAVAATTVVTITCTDELGAAVNAVVTVNPPPLTITLTPIQVIGRANNNVTPPPAESPDNTTDDVSVSVIGGSGPYIITNDKPTIVAGGPWASATLPFSVTVDPTNVLANTVVTFTATDGEGNLATATLVVYTENTPLVTSTDKQNVIGLVNPDGGDPADDVSITVAGANNPFIVSWVANNGTDCQIGATPVTPYVISGTSGTVVFDPGANLTGVAKACTINVTDKNGAVNTLQVNIFP